MSSVTSVQAAGSFMLPVIPPALSDDDLTRLAHKLAVRISDSREQLLENCFEAAYEACKNKKWELIASDQDKISSLTNRVGHSLLVEAFSRGDFETTNSLIERSISLLSFKKVKQGVSVELKPELRQQRAAKALKLGDFFQAYKDLKKAEQYYLLNLALAKQTNNRIQKGITYIVLGKLYIQNSLSLKAIALVNKGLKIINGQSPDYVLMGHLALAFAYGQLELYEEEIKNYEAYFCFEKKLLAESSARGESPQIKEMSIVYRLDCSYSYQEIGVLEKALDLLQEAIELLKKMEESIFQKDFLPKAYLNIGQVLVKMKNFEEAIHYYANAIKLATVIDLKFRAFGGMASALNNLGDHKSVLKLLSQAFSIPESRNLTASTGPLYQQQGVALAALERNEEALGALKKALAAAESSKDKSDLVHIYAVIGSAFLYIKDFSAAEDSSRKACSLFSQTSRHFVKQPEWKITMFEDQIVMYEILESALAEQTKTMEQLQVSGMRRSRALLQCLADKYPTPSAESLIQEGMTVKSMQELAARQETTFVIYSIALFSWLQKKTLHAWVVAPTGNPEFVSLPIIPIEEDITNFKALLKKFPFSQTRGSDSSEDMEISSMKEFAESIRGDEKEVVVKQAFEDAQKKFRKKLAGWYEALIKPIEEFLPKDDKQTVTFVPDGFLAQLPFAIMQDQKGTYFIEKHPVSVAPSIQILQQLEEISATREKSAERKALIIGNPLLNNPKPLWIGQQEAETVSQLLQAKEGYVLIQEKATVSEFLAKAPDADYIYASCHGEASCKPESNPHSVFEGQLKLAPDHKYLTGNLHSQLISQLDLKAKLVFLSACYSGTGKLQQEGVIGNVWSFLAAGALSIVSTYWPLPEKDTTKEMVQCFFSHLLGINAEKLNQAQALRQAMLFGMRENRDSIRQWGSFYVSGLIQFDKTDEAQIALFKKVKGLGIKHREKGENAQAAPFLEQAFNLGQSLPNFPEEELSLICHLLGNIYRALQKYEEAQNYLLRARDLREKNPMNVIDRVKTLNSLGLLYRDMKDFEHAKEAFKAALELIKMTDVGADLAGIVQRNMDRLKLS